MTPEEIRLRCEEIRKDYEKYGIKEQSVTPCMRVRMLCSGDARYLVETTRLPQSPGIRKRLTFTSIEDAISTMCSLLPEPSRVNNIRDGRARKEAMKAGIPCNPIRPAQKATITPEMFLQQVCDWRVLVADAHACAIESGDKNTAFFFQLVDEPMKKLMQESDVANQYVELPDDNELTLPV